MPDFPCPNVPSVFRLDRFKEWTPPSRKRPSSLQPSRQHHRPKKPPITKLPQVSKHQLPARPPRAVCVNASTVASSDTSRGPQSPSQRSPTLRSGTTHHTPSDTQPTHRLSSSPKSRASPLSNRDLATSQAVHDTLDSPIEAPSFAEHIASYTPTPSISSADENWQEFPQPAHEQNGIPIDPVILSNNGPWEMEDEHHHTSMNDAVISVTNCPYPDPPPLLCDTLAHHLRSNIYPEVHEGNSWPDTSLHNHSHSQHLIPGLVDEDMSTTRSQLHEENRRPRMGNNVESTQSPLRGPQEKRFSDDLNRPGSRKRSSGMTSEPGKESSKRRRLDATTSTEISRPSLLSYFLSRPINERLEFLSSLFEMALPHCTSEPQMVTGDLSERPEVDAQARKQVRWAPIPKPAESRDGNVRLKKYKRARWSPEEDDLLLELRRRKLPWSEVKKVFSTQYPGRSLGSIQVHWSTALRKRF